MASYEIPLSDGSQIFSASISGELYQFTIKWIESIIGLIDGFWVLDISDSDSNLMLSGIPLVPGDSVLTQFRYAELGFSLSIFVKGDQSKTPDYNSLPDSTLLITTE